MVTSWCRFQGIDERIKKLSIIKIVADLADAHDHGVLAGDDVDALSATTADIGHTGFGKGCQGDGRSVAQRARHEGDRLEQPRHAACRIEWRGRK